MYRGLPLTLALRIRHAKINSPGGIPAFFTPRSMTPLERFNRALQIRTALEELMTTEEADMYLAGIDDHYDDFLRDLRIAYQETLGSI